jgi:hypothetical protein
MTDANGSYDQTYVVFTDANGFYSLGGIPEGANVRVTVLQSTLPSSAYVQTGDPDGAPLSERLDHHRHPGQCRTTSTSATSKPSAASPAPSSGQWQRHRRSRRGTVVEGVTVTLTYSAPTASPAPPTTWFSPPPPMPMATTNSPASCPVAMKSPPPSRRLPCLRRCRRIQPQQHQRQPRRSAQDVTGRDFEYQSGSLSGTSGRIQYRRHRDAGEPPIIGATVFLDLDGNGQLDPGEPSTTTDSLGFYQFEELNSGTYQVRVDPLSLVTGSFPTYDLDGIGTPNLAVVVLTPNQNLENVDFGYSTEPPVAANDEDLGNTPGTAVTLDSPANDTASAGRTLDLTSVEIAGAPAATARRSWFPAKAPGPWTPPPAK